MPHTVLDKPCGRAEGRTALSEDGMPLRAEGRLLASAAPDSRHQAQVDYRSALRESVHEWRPWPRVLRHPKGVTSSPIDSQVAHSVIGRIHSSGPAASLAPEGRGR